MLVQDRLTELTETNFKKNISIGPRMFPYADEQAIRGTTGNPNITIIGSVKKSFEYSNEAFMLVTRLLSF